MLDEKMAPECTLWHLLALFGTEQWHPSMALSVMVLSLWSVLGHYGTWRSTRMKALIGTLWHSTMALSCGIEILDTGLD